MEKMLAIIIGALLVGIGVNGFLVPHHLLDGGMIGLGLIFHYYLGYPTGLCILVLSIPLYIIAWIYERKYFYHGIHGLILTSFSIDVLDFLRELFFVPIFLGAVIGGILVGVGIGLMLIYETSTGGTDMIAQILAKKVSINVGWLILFIDGIIVVLGLSILEWHLFLYSLITIVFVGILTSMTVHVKH
jgi:uncharacterized membrane-anchored protein YitT (DUF2179 family)